MYLVLIVFIVQIVVNVIGIKAQLDLYDVKRDKVFNLMNPTVPIWYVFLILGWVMWLLGVVEPDIPERRAVVIIFLLFSGVCIIFQVMIFGTVIIYNEQGISIGWFRFHKKYYQYEDIVGSREGDVSEIRDDYSKEIMYIGKQKIFSNIYGEKFEEFKKYAFARYEEKLGTAPSQTVAEHRIEEKYPILDIYHGNVRNIVNEWIVFVLMFLVATVPIGVSIYDIIDEIEESDTTYVKADILSYSLYDTRLELVVEEYRYELVLFVDGYEDHQINKIINAIHHDWQLCLNMRLDSGKYDIYYKIYQIEDLYGNTYVTFDDVNNYDKQKAIEFLPVFIGIALILSVYGAVRIKVGRNPHKYSKRMRQLFFKKDAWKITFDNEEKV